MRKQLEIAYHRDFCIARAKHDRVGFGMREGNAGRENESREPNPWPVVWRDNLRTALHGAVVRLDFVIPGKDLRSASLQGGDRGLTGARQAEHGDRFSGETASLDNAAPLTGSSTLKGRSAPERQQRSRNG